MSMDDNQKQESPETSADEGKDADSMPVEEAMDASEEASEPRSNAEEPEAGEQEAATKDVAEKGESNIIFFDKRIEGKFQKTVVGVLAVILSPVIAVLSLGITAAVVALIGIVVLLVVALAFSIVLVVLIALFFALPILIPIAILFCLITGKGKVIIGRRGVKIGGK